MQRSKSVQTCFLSPTYSYFNVNYCNNKFQPKIDLFFQLNRYNHETRLSISLMVSMRWWSLVSPFFWLLVGSTFVVMVMVMVPLLLNSSFAVVRIRDYHF